MPEKTFVLDTNVLLHDANALYAFGKNKVIIPIDVIEELDKFKKENTDIGRNARQVIRELDHLRETGVLGLSADGAQRDGHGPIAIDMKTVCLLEAGLQTDSPDNRILSIAWRRKNEGDEVVLVSKDMNQRIKASALAIPAEDFENQKVNIDELYAGWRELSVEAAVLTSFFDGGKAAVKLEKGEPALRPNEFLLLRDLSDRKHTALGRAGKDAATIEALRSPHNARAFGILPRNLEQRIALELLLDPAIRLVTLVGKAGTGKTLLALAAGLQMACRDNAYEKVLVSRPIMPLGRDLGYLPGTKDEKLEHWMQPIFDNLQLLLRDPGKDGRRRLEELMRNGKVALEALTYIRGRSIHDQYLIVDEAQNLTPHEVKTIISRAGERTKLVLTGDPYQIDNPYLDSESNGLCYAVERMKNNGLHGHITLTRSERSELAAVAAELL